MKLRGLGYWVCVSQRKRFLFELLELKKETEFQLSTCKGKKIKGFGKKLMKLPMEANAKRIKV